MATARKKLTIREQIFNERVKAWNLYERMQVQKVLENTSEDKQEDIYSSYINIYRYWGGVEFIYWLRAVGDICRHHNKDIENFAIFHLPARDKGDKTKIFNLQIIAKQMGLDVTITNNRQPKPAVVRKPRVTTPKVKRGPGERGARV
jgi:hypothetical protein